MQARARRLIPVAVLYGGRIGVAALGLIILPWLSRSMPDAQFGLAATVLSLQSLSVVLDLGLSVGIARHLPLLTEREARALVRRNERTLLRLYLGIGGIAMMLTAAGALPISYWVALLITLSLLLIVWQNLIVTAFISRQRYIAATTTQFFGLLLRHACSLALVVLHTGTLEAFVMGQVAGAVLILAVSRYAFRGRHRRDPPAVGPARAGGVNIIIMIYTVAGACALQLDKILLTALASAEHTGPYFLASTLALVPITFLATPVSQFVQPKLIGSLARGDQEQARRWVARLTLAVAGLAVVPGILLGIASPWIVGLWLQGAPNQHVVGQYAMVLTPGAALGALGLVPAIILIARHDYPAMAVISCTLAIAVLSATGLLATSGNVIGICLAYALYHVLAAATLWWRAGRIEPYLCNPFAIRYRAANEHDEGAGSTLA